MAGMSIDAIVFELVPLTPELYFVNYNTTKSILTPCWTERGSMYNTISLIYGMQVLDDLEFCTKHEDVIERYSHGIMTLQGSPMKTLQEVALDPASVPGWTHLLASHPEDCKILKEFFARLINHYKKTGGMNHTGQQRHIPKGK